MGYTHYFTQHKTASKSQWAKIQDDFKKVAAHEDCPKIWGNPYDDENSAPVVNGDEILFNGGYETMHVTRKIGERQSWRRGEEGVFNFCKTACKPYDSVVVALLVIMAKHASKVWDISSDGEPEDWREGLDLAKSATGNPKLKVPSTVKAYDGH